MWIKPSSLCCIPRSISRRRCHLAERFNLKELWKSLTCSITAFSVINGLSSGHGSSLSVTKTWGVSPVRRVMLLWAVVSKPVLKFQKCLLSSKLDSLASTMKLYGSMATQMIFPFFFGLLNQSVLQKIPHRMISLPKHTQTTSCLRSDNSCRCL